MITINAGVFTREVKPLVKISESKTGIEITQCLYIQPSETSIRIIATNLELSMEVTIDGESNYMKPFCVDAKLTNNLFSKLGNSVAVMSVDESKKIVTIKSDYGKYTLPIIKHDEFPLLKDYNSSPGISIAPTILQKILNKARYFVLSDTMRPALGGVLFDLSSKGILSIVSTDTHKLYNAETKNLIDNPDTSFPNQLIISKQAAQLLVDKISKSDTRNVDVYFENTTVFFVFESWALQAVSVEGKYPPYKSVIPNKKNATGTFTVSKSSFIEAGDRVDSVVGLDSVNLFFDKKEVTISRENTSNNAEAKEVISAQTLGAGEIGFQWKDNLRIALSNCDDNQITAYYTSRDKALTIDSSNDDIDELFLIMPTLIR